MKTVEPIIVSSLSEASEADVVDGALAVISAPDASAATGYTTKKSLLSRIKDYIIGHTSISGVGDGTVTGAISALNSDLAQISTDLSQLITTRVFACENISMTAGTAGTRGGQKTVDVALSGYTPIAVGLTQVNDSSLANVVPFFGSNGNPNTVFVNAYRASGNAGTVTGIYFRVIYIKS